MNQLMHKPEFTGKSCFAVNPNAGQSTAFLHLSDFLNLAKAGEKVRHQYSTRYRNWTAF